MMNNKYDVIVVGAGAAGCTAAAYVAREGKKVLLIEKDAKCGGLLGSFQYKGHTLDQGARGIIDSGIVYPMLRQLNMDVPMVDNPVKMLIGKDAMVFDKHGGVEAYGRLLKEVYPENSDEIDIIIKDIVGVMKAMDVLYGIENPLFLPKPYKLDYVMKTLLPWTVRFALNMSKPLKLMEPILTFLRKRTSNESLVYMISQHFFEDTPTFFALSYFTLYSEYNYPLGGTQSLVDGWVKSILADGGKIKNHVEVTSVDPTQKLISTTEGLSYEYDQLIWAADMTLFYSILQKETIEDKHMLEDVRLFEGKIKDKLGSDSVFSLYLLVNQDANVYQKITGPHAFYTKEIEGLSKISLDQLKDKFGSFIKDKEKVFDWVKSYVRYNTFEISIPALRDPSLSPQGESGLIISILFDYSLNKHIVDCDWYDEFKEVVSLEIIATLKEELMPQLDEHVIGRFVATPWTIAHRTNNYQGSLTGWSFKNQPFPVEHRFLHVSKAVKTPIPSIKQAGQWTFNPAGVPVAILTGKLAADAVLADLKKRK